MNYLGFAVLVPKERPIIKAASVEEFMRLPKFFPASLTVVCLVGVAQGIPSPKFIEPLLYPIANVGSSLVIGDFNGDGRPDVATANDTANSVSVLLRTANGFSPMWIMRVAEIPWTSKPATSTATES